MTAVDVDYAARIRVSTEVGRQAPLASVATVLRWLRSVEVVAALVGEARYAATDPARGVRQPPPGRLWVERLKYENPLEVVLGGALCVLVYRIITVIRDWKTEQRARNAEASTLEAVALDAHQAAERKRLENQLITELLTQLPASDARKRDLVEQVLRQGIQKRLEVLAEPPADVDAEILKG